MKRKAAEELVRDLQGQHMQIDQNLLLNGTDNNRIFCYSMIWKYVALYSII